MAVKPIPDGFHSVTPYLFVDGVAKLLDFVKAAFDAKEEVCLRRDDGSVMHAVVRIGDSPVMMGDPTGPAAEFGPMPSSIYLYVNDCDSVYQRALEAGGKSVMEVTDIPFNGERYGGKRPGWQHLVDCDSRSGRLARRVCAERGSGGKVATAALRHWSLGRAAHLK
jgi:PhnB protein